MFVITFMFAITFSCYFELPPSLVLQQFHGDSLSFLANLFFLLNQPELISATCCLDSYHTAESLNSGLSTNEQRCRDGNNGVYLEMDLREKAGQRLELQKLLTASWVEHWMTQYRVRSWRDLNTKLKSIDFILKVTRPWPKESLQFLF